jgi:hypothetical protein
LKLDLFYSRRSRKSSSLPRGKRHDPCKLDILYEELPL